MSEQPVEPQDGWPAMPASVKVHPTVDLGAPDPTLVDDRRTCIAARVTGERCAGRAMNGLRTCAIHSERTTPLRGAMERAARAAERRDKAESALVAQRLGTRALVAAIFAERAADVERALGHLLTAAGSGDIKSAQALLPWMTQALGQPTERVEHVPPASVEDLARVDSATLEALVARGRAKRLSAVPEPNEDAG